ncbi:hypothetical protein Cycma_2705 [Cyclobacterium marinum DSM 745]|uniref:Uncharacterized protein n=1 Tax=Cyclobacterium marinum (strain ATCC 25205 / DSM 745 / LMG 13164 / NCIMB 1802) TaxID=880070 RepID=G0IYM1_CYCMS|nr:hypothetical protein Cycma_2705 [Cyclobacterium marinum DSM 745]
MLHQIALYRSRIVLLIRRQTHKLTTKRLVYPYVVKFYRIFQQALLSMELFYGVGNLCTGRIIQSIDLGIEDLLNIFTSMLAE